MGLFTAGNWLPLLETLKILSPERRGGEPSPALQGISPRLILPPCHTNHHQSHRNSQKRRIPVPENREEAFVSH